MASSFLDREQGCYGPDGPFVPRLVTSTSGASISLPITNASAFYILWHVNHNHGPFHVTLTLPSTMDPHKLFTTTAQSGG
jgi:hypothetical protein